MRDTEIHFCFQQKLIITNIRCAIITQILYAEWQIPIVYKRKYRKYMPRSREGRSGSRQILCIRWQNGDNRMYINVLLSAYFKAIGWSRWHWIACVSDTHTKNMNFGWWKTNLSLASKHFHPFVYVSLRSPHCSFEWCLKENPHRRHNEYIFVIMGELLQTEVKSPQK